MKFTEEKTIKAIRFKGQVRPLKNPLTLVYFLTPRMKDRMAFKNIKDKVKFGLVANLESSSDRNIRGKRKADVDADELAHEFLVNDMSIKRLF